MSDWHTLWETIALAMPARDLSVQVSGVRPEVVSPNGGVWRNGVLACLTQGGRITARCIQSHHPGLGRLSEALSRAWNLSVHIDMELAAAETERTVSAQPHMRMCLAMAGSQQITAESPQTTNCDTRIQLNAGELLVLPANQSCHLHTTDRTVACLWFNTTDEYIASNWSSADPRNWFAPLIESQDSAPNTAHQVSFEELIAPLSASEFRCQYWQRQHLLIKSVAALRQRPLFSLADLQSLLSSAASDASRWTFFGARDALDQASQLPKERIDLATAQSLYRLGATVRITQVPRHHAALRALMRQLTELFDAQCNVTAWLSRAVRSSEPHVDDYLHYDNPEQFIVQIHGARRWRLWPRRDELYSPRRSDPEVAISDYGEPMFDAVLHAGDILYVPAGAPHALYAAAQDSLHLSVAISPTSWRDVLDEALRLIDQHGSPLAVSIHSDHARLTSLRHQVSQALNMINDQALTQVMAQRRVNNAWMDTDAHLWRHVLQTPRVDAHTSLQRRVGVNACVELSADNEQATLLFSGGGQVAGPGALAPTWQAMVNRQQPFKPTDLSDDYDLESRCLLAEQLMRLGFLELSTVPVTTESSCMVE